MGRGGRRPKKGFGRKPVSCVGDGSVGRSGGVDAKCRIRLRETVVRGGSYGRLSGPT